MPEGLRPPPHPRNPIKCLGFYVGLAVDPDVNWDDICKFAYDHGYNQISVFLTTVFMNKGNFYPWPYTGGKYNFDLISIPWRVHIRKMFESCAFWRITPHICFVDQFHDVEDNPGPDPFRTGGNFDSEALYSSVQFNPTKFAWVRWDEPTPRHYTNFRPTSPLGQGMFKYVRTVVGEAKRVKELNHPNGNPLYPDFRVSWKWANETNAFFHAGETHPYKTHGDRDEIFVWIQKQWLDAGFKEGGSLFSYFDYAAWVSDNGLKFYMPAMKSSFSAIRKFHNARLEVHEVINLTAITQLNAGANILPRFMLYSTDGDLKMEGDYKGLGRSAYNTDLKVDVGPGESVPPTATEFANKLLPRYKEFVKDISN